LKGIQIEGYKYKEEQNKQVQYNAGFAGWPENN
jgi:hypothetical protein